MIKAIILDIDGVIIGEKKGFNTPDPHPLVIQKLREIRAKGIFVSLCTAKPNFAIRKIITDTGLNNIHITDGGGVIINPLTNEIIKEINLDPSTTSEVVAACLNAKIYTEVYTTQEYYISQDQEGEITNMHTFVLQKPPALTDNLAKVVQREKITKITTIAHDLEDRRRVEAVLDNFSKVIDYYWTIHPVALPLQFTNINPKGVSKREGAKDIARGLGIPLSQILGVGDSASDWKFIEICGYGAAMGNAEEKLKELVKTKGVGKYNIGKSVDENGVIGIFDHFRI